MFLNEPSSIEDSISLDEYNDYAGSSAKKPQAEDCNYVSIQPINISQDDSYQEYLNNADLAGDASMEEAKSVKNSVDRRKVIKSTANNKAKKSIS